MIARLVLMTTHQRPCSFRLQHQSILPASIDPTIVIRTAPILSNHTRNIPTIARSSCHRPQFGAVPLQPHLPLFPLTFINSIQLRHLLNYKLHRSILTQIEGLLRALLHT